MKIAHIKAAVQEENTTYSSVDLARPQGIGGLVGVHRLAAGDLDSESNAADS